ncbi:hypothetical protein N5D52_28490 [Pseudomonas sp. GD03860]|uniref:hypothetical protein n=1 Tax=Pseudomonas TaxID=286 RepID=UPI002363731D|nr:MULTISPECIES: hypothetical protein [Pseudomonas]MDD2058446.1 hypothetical protein [Pseudomonas putida]MDH0640872.1 hypothetical protein [Pseudomonas sp. GD03860]
MADIVTVYFIPSLGQEISDFLVQTVPKYRRRKVTRYLQHFDLWLRHTQYKSLSDSLPLEAYVYFYLTHISLYLDPVEPSEFACEYLRTDIDTLLIRRKLKGYGRLTSRQAASRIAAAMNWQEHCFRKNLDPFRSSMKKLYKHAKHFVHLTELTSKPKLYSADLLELISRTGRGLGSWVRDLAMLRLLQETGCTTSDLAAALSLDFERQENDDWHFKYGNELTACLNEDTATLVEVLLGRYFHLSKYRDDHQHLFTMGYAEVELKMSAHDIEMEIERRYRFALMVTSVICPTDTKLYVKGATPFPEGFIGERTMPISPHEKINTVVNLQFSESLNTATKHSASATLEAQYFYEDWDTAIRNSTLVLPESETSDSGKITDNTHCPKLQKKRLLIVGEDIDESAWADWGEN